MAQQWQDMGQGLKVREDTPKEAPLTQEFVRDLTKGSESKVFTEKIEEIAQAAADAGGLPR